MRTVELANVRAWPRRSSANDHLHRPGGVVAAAPGNVPPVSSPASVVNDSGIAVGIYAVQGDANPGDSVSNQGGPLVVTAPLELIYWGSAWQQAANPSPSAITTAVNAILAGPYLTQMRQYGYLSVTLRGSTLITAPNPPINFTTAAAGNLVWNAIDQGLFPEPDDSGGRNIYMVLMPPGTNPPAGIRGAHADPSDYDFPFDVDYAWVGWVGNGSLDFITDVLSHELVESISDPEPNSPAWVMDRSLNGGVEIGDACNNTVDRIDKLLLQAYWSQSHRACVIPFGPFPVPHDSGVATIVARSPSHMDLFWVHPDGSINSTWWDANVNNGAWDPARVFAATGPGKAQPGW